MFLVEEMEFIERLIVNETTKASEQTDNASAKDTFSRWARESEFHGQTLRRIAEKLRVNASSKPSVRGLGMIDLRDVALMHLNIEGDAERRYSQMAEMAEDSDLKKTFTELASAERRHHGEAQILSDSINQLIAEGVKGNRQ
jgi:rubrerythrin